MKGVSRFLRVSGRPWAWSMAAALFLCSPSPGVATELQVHSPDSVRTLNRAYLTMGRYVQDVQGLYSAPQDAAEYARLRRPEVIRVLDASAAVIPGDDWIHGHRVGLRIKQGDLAEALEVARTCEGSAWWCAALTGFVLHLEGERLGAESAFRFALERMPEEIRCEWEDVSFLLEGPVLAEYVAQDCRSRRAFERRLWWLADPLHLEPGNERWMEHLARRVALRLHEESLALVGTECSDRHRRSIIRQGWPEHWWSWERPFVPVQNAPGTAFLPRSTALSRPYHAQPSDWFEAPDGQSERYLRPAGSVLPIEHQAAVFLRGDSMVVAAATPRMDDPGARAGLALTADEGRRPVVTLGDPGAASFLRAVVPAVPHLLSIEVAAGAGGAGRARMGVRPPNPAVVGFALSDPLLFEWVPGLAEELDAILPHMLGSTVVPRRTAIGLYWEVYGLRDRQELSVSLATIPEEAGFLRRVGQLLRLVDRREGVEFGWSEASEEGEVVGRFLRVDLSGLSPGRYTIELSVDAGGSAPLRLRRTVQLEPD